MDVGLLCGFGFVGGGMFILVVLDIVMGLVVGKGLRIGFDFL